MDFLKNTENKKRHLIKEGEKKVNELRDVRKKMMILNPDDPKDMEILEKLEDKEIKIVHELSKLDVGVKILEVIEFIIRKGIFRGYWGVIEKNIPYDRIIEIVVNNGLNVKKICMDIYKEANIDDEEVLKNIEKLPDDSKKYESIEDTDLDKLDKIKDRFKKLKILRGYFDKKDALELKDMILKD
jgi:hypothetical protein